LLLYSVLSLPLFLDLNIATEEASPPAVGSCQRSPSPVDLLPLPPGPLTPTIPSPPPFSPVFSCSCPFSSSLPADQNFKGSLVRHREFLGPSPRISHTRAVTQVVPRSPLSSTPDSQCSPLRRARPVSPWCPVNRSLVSSRSTSPLPHPTLSHQTLHRPDEISLRGGDSSSGTRERMIRKVRPDIRFRDRDTSTEFIVDAKVLLPERPWHWRPSRHSRALLPLPRIVVAHRHPASVKVQRGTSMLTSPRSRSPSRYFRRAAQCQHQIRECSDLSLQRARRKLHLRIRSHRCRQVWRVFEGERFADPPPPKPPARTIIANSK